MFLKTQECGLVPLAPVVSNVIHDKKAHSDLQIVDYSDDSSPVQGQSQNFPTLSICVYLDFQFYSYFTNKLMIIYALIF